MFHIGSHQLTSQVLLAPMAGVSDAPFRHVCEKMGAGLTTSEMITANTELWQSRKSSQRLAELHTANSTLPRSVQIAGSEAKQLADAARAAVDLGADIVDINMGCPAKKVCSQAAGSALLRDENLVKSILHAVVSAVSVPVTLKIRTGWCPATRNGVQVAQLAEAAGVQALVVHGRTRACRFNGAAEYHTIAAIVAAVNIPVIANGDIDSVEKATQVLNSTGAKAVMIGRAAQGRPWLIREVQHHLATGEQAPLLTVNEATTIVAEHLTALYSFYGEQLGVRIARKHIKWYLHSLTEYFAGYGKKMDLTQDLSTINAMESPSQQFAHVQQTLARLTTTEELTA